MFLLKIKCSEVKVPHFYSEGAEGGTKADMFTASAADLSCLFCRCAHVGHRDNPGSLSLILLEPLQGNMT